MNRNDRLNPDPHPSSRRPEIAAMQSRTLAERIDKPVAPRHARPVVTDRDRRMEDPERWDGMS